MTTALNHYRYRLFCKTENKHVVTVIDSTGQPDPPAACPNDSAHIIARDSVKLMTTTYGNEVTVYQNESADISGYFQAKTIPVSISNDDSVPTSFDLSIPMPVVIYSVTLPSLVEQKGDRICVDVAPEMTIGYTTADAAIGSTVFEVNSTVLQQLSIGQIVHIAGEELGHCTAIGFAASTITTEFANKVAVAPNATVASSTRYIDMVFSSRTPITFQLGDPTVGGTLLPASIPIRVTYWNYSTGTKATNVVIQYRY